MRNTPLKIASLSSVICLSSITLSASVNSSPITVTPGQDLRSIVAAAPEGTTFIFAPGNYRMQTIIPKNKDVFTGKGKVVMNGSIVLSSFSTSGSNYVAAGKNVSVETGICQPGHPLCGWTQDLFIDNVLQTLTSSPIDLPAGSWYFDRSTGNIYIPTNPKGHLVELTMQTTAISGFVPGGYASGVKISNLTIEKYATPAHSCTVGNGEFSPNWVIDNVEVAWNHGIGIGVGAASQVSNSYLHNNGQMGLSVSFGTGSQVLNNEISFNNYAWFAYNWEAGGTKFWQTTNLIVKNNWVHDNNGKGLWTDTNNVGTLYDSNTVVNNYDVGIQHECSYAAIIRGNIVEGNVPVVSNWLGAAQIRIMASSSTQIYNNTISSSAIGGNGIALIHQTRGMGSQGVWATANNYVHNNTITYPASVGETGFENDGGDAALATGNTFDYNTYVIQSSGVLHWAWAGTESWSRFKGLGQETHGSTVTK